MTRAFVGMNFRKLLKSNIPPVEFLVEKFVVKAGLTYLFGPPGAFKSNFMLYMSLNAIQGKNLFNFNIKHPIKILWIDEENRDRGMKDKITKLTKNMEINGVNDNNLLIFYSNNFNILEKEDLKSLEQYISKGSYDLVVIDSIAKVFPLDERHEKDVAKIYKALEPLMNQGTSFVLIHHARKAGQGQTYRTMEDISGSREFAAMADNMIYMQAIYNTNQFLVKNFKPRHHKPFEDFTFSVEGENELIVEYVGLKGEELIKQISAEIIQYTKENQKDQYTTRDFQDNMQEKGFKETNIYNALNLLVNGKYLVKPKQGIYEVKKLEEAEI